MVLVAVASSLCPATTARTFLPPQKIHGAANGVSGVLRGCSQEQGALTGQSSEAKVSSGHDEESGALTGSLQPPPYQQQADKSPWTRPARQGKTVPEDTTRLKTALLDGYQVQVQVFICHIHDYTEIV